MTPRTSTSSGIVGTEAVIDTVVVPVVAGRTYAVVWDSCWQASAVSGQIRCRIREDNLTGNQLQLRQLHAPLVATQSEGQRVMAEYTADATEDKTFVLTAVRQSGTATWTSVAGSDNPSYFYADYIEDS
jgi:hypothetical protein